MSLDVLAIAAHPDDIEQTCGGTLDVLITRGEPGSDRDPTVIAHRRALELLETGDAAVIVTPVEATSAPYTVAAEEFDPAVGQHICPVAGHRPAHAVDGREGTGGLLGVPEVSQRDEVAAGQPA